MAFLSASQLRSEEAVTFEVSMGNYGNVLDDTLPASSSSPPSVCPQYDGVKYHFAPWADSKPCVLLESHWEDIEYRLHALNMLLRVIDRLVRHSLHVAVELLTLTSYSFSYSFATAQLQALFVVITVFTYCLQYIKFSTGVVQFNRT